MTEQLTVIPRTRLHAKAHAHFILSCTHGTPQHMR